MASDVLRWLDSRCSKKWGNLLSLDRHCALTLPPLQLALALALALQYGTNYIYCYCYCTVRGRRDGT
jgi:hypothetical protein